MSTEYGIKVTMYGDEQILTIPEHLTEMYGDMKGRVSPDGLVIGEVVRREVTEWEPIDP